MHSMYVSVKKVLEQNPIQGSAPCRIDSGGTWDIKAMALPFEKIGPATLNMALNLRTTVVLFPYKEGWVKIGSEGFARDEEQSVDRLVFNSPFGPFFAAISHFGFHGLTAKIESDSPVKSALGGSSTALVALIKALSKLRVSMGGKGLSNEDTLHLAYHVEDGISGGNCGIQDQAAAVYGGVNLWIWNYGKRGNPLKKKSLLNKKGERELSRCIIVAYSGKSHASAHINLTWVRGFLGGEKRAGWIQINDIVKDLANSIKEREWNNAAMLLRKEMAVRREITPQALIPITRRLIDLAEDAGCGARFAGAGGGGSVWALGEPGRILRLRKNWEKELAPIKGAGILGCTIDHSGAR
jgi:D-glycero-alpha-D-manno-heptose-7-phosphate kinase